MPAQRHDMHVLHDLRQPDPLVRRALPAVHRLMSHPQAAPLIDAFGRERTREAIRAQLASVRAAWRSGCSLIDEEGWAEGLLRQAERTLRQRPGGRLVPVINGTGVVLHTNLGRAPLAREAIDAMVALAEGYCNLEYDLERGSRSTRYQLVGGLLCQLTGAQDALVVNNGAAAVLLALAALAGDGEVIVSRGELVEIGGGFRIPEVVAQGGARLVEVGATNKTRLADYERAISPRTRLILRVHPSNFRISGFTESVPRRGLVDLARSRGLRVVEDLGSGALSDLADLSLPHEPTVQESVADGVDLVTFSGDKLLGGPQAGLLVGGAGEIAELRTHPLLRALRVDKLTLAALEATLLLHGRPEASCSQVPALRMLAEPLDSLRHRAVQLSRLLERFDWLRSEVIDGMSLPGGGALPGAQLPAALVRIVSRRERAGALARRLRVGSPPLVGRVADEALLLDVRTIAPAQLPQVAEAFEAIAP
jgi:L-seryl-tRNA(Ser) seleniumtransferase